MCRVRSRCAGSRASTGWRGGRSCSPTCGARASRWRACGSPRSRSAWAARPGTMRWCGCGGGGTVEMAAWRPFGPIRYPTWWVSEMTVDPLAREIRYRHVRGMTRGMDVVWRFRPQAEAWARRDVVLKDTALQRSASPSPRFRVGTANADPRNDGVLVTIVHEWGGPAWPLVGPLAATLVIGPVFIQGIALRTLAGIK